MNSSTKPDEVKRLVKSAFGNGNTFLQHSFFSHSTETYKGQCVWSSVVLLTEVY